MGLNDVIRRLGEDVTRYPLASQAPADGDGHADISFGSPETIRVRISTADAEQYNRDELGQVRLFKFFMTVPQDETVAVDDRIIFDGEPYRVTERLEATRNDFQRFTLVGDDRVADADTGDTDTSGETDDGFEWN